MAIRKRGKMIGVTSRTKGTSVYWYARVDGRRVYCGKGNEGKEIAVAARGKYDSKQYENKALSAGLKPKKDRFKNVRELVDWYMLLPSVQLKKSYDTMISRCVNLVDYFGSKSLVQVETEDQERYRMLRSLQGAAAGTIDNEISLLRAVFHRARKAKKIDYKLMPGEFLILNGSSPRRIITDDEFQALKKAAGDDFKDLLIAGYETAMRRGELIDLRANQVHLGVSHISGIIVDYISLPAFGTKTKTPRTVPISAELRGILVRRLEGLEDEDHVFTFGGSLYRKSTVPKLMRACCKAAGIEYGDKVFNEHGERIGIVFHCLRHTRTTKWVEMGFSDEIIRRATGHADLKSYQQYVKLDASVVMRLVDGVKTVQKARKVKL